MGKRRIAINGFGRIGRTLMRVLQNSSEIEVVAINDLADIKTLSHLLKYDSIHGRYPDDVIIDGDFLLIGDLRVRFFHEQNPAELPWSGLNIDVVVECTGHFRTMEGAGKHIAAGAGKVIISAPAQDARIKTICMGINDSILESSDIIISNASCTTNSAAPLVHVMKELGVIESAYITTVHSYTNDQRLHDTPHRDLRRARAAALSIVPTTTGAAKAITKIFPELDGITGGAGIRVPVPNGSLTDMNFVLKESLTEAVVNAAFKKAAEGTLKGVLQYTEDPLVSVDVIDNPHSSIFDAQLTSVIGKMVKVVGWYDNEFGYSNRLKDLILKITS